jgi:hypothetical protein
MREQPSPPPLLARIEEEGEGEEETYENEEQIL